MEAQAQGYQKIEEVFEDKYCEVFATILAINSVDSLKNKLKVLKDQGTDVNRVFCSYFHFFTIEQTLNFPEFVNWCANNYSSSERVIMDVAKSKIICPVN